MLGNPLGEKVKQYELRGGTLFSLYENTSTVVLDILWVVDLFPGQLQSYGKMHATALSFSLTPRYVTHYKFCCPRQLFQIPPSSQWWLCTNINLESRYLTTSPKQKDTFVFQ